MDIRTYSADRSDEIADLFYESVYAIDPSVYTTEEKAAWAPAPIDYQRWRVRLDQKRPFLAIIDDRVAGFIELEADGHIDCAYTHPDFQGRGVASALYQHLLKEAEARKLQRLYVEASHVAKPFLERRGFSVVKTNHIDPIPHEKIPWEHQKSDS